MTESWRCFVGVPLDDRLRAQLADAVAGWQTRLDLAGLRWTAPEAWHLTLAFLGATDPAAVPSLGARLRAVGNAHRVLHLRTGGLGAFPSPVRARVAWYGIESSIALTALAADVALAAGLEPFAVFAAHVTLGRARRRPIDLRAWLEEPAPVGELVVERMELIRSRLGSGPAHYETLVSVPLRDVAP
jgi:2'-5' RNA ligase